MGLPGVQQPVMLPTASLLEGGKLPANLNDTAHSITAGAITGTSLATSGGGAISGGAITGSDLLNTAAALTAGTMTAGNATRVRTTWHAFTWTNAMVAALGASLTGDIKVCTLPAKTIVTNAYIVITGQAAGTATLTVALGRTAASYIDYLTAQTAQAAANTVYGDASGERGTNLVSYDLPSFTGTTDVFTHWVSTVQNLSAVTGSAGTVYLQTELLP